MTIIQLKYAIAVAEYRNFTVAADKCFVTQPTLSMQIQKLEAELDITIFDRTKKPIAISDVGIKIIQQSKKIVSESEKMQDVVDQDRGVIGGILKLVLSLQSCQLFYHCSSMNWLAIIQCSKF
jgi:LysR family hydrogen peroxide-inducible transcriptional activator